MIQPQTILKVSDNSGARYVRCIKILGRTNHKIKKNYDIILVSVIKIKPKLKKNIKKGDLFKALIIRTAKNMKRFDGSYIKCNKNVVILLKKEKLQPVATRLFGPILKEFKKNTNFSKAMTKKIISLSSILI